MKKYRLKREAVPFFPPNHGETITELHIWERERVHINALEEVEDVYIKYGTPFSENGTTLSGWDGEKQEAHFEFSVICGNMPYAQYKALGGNIPLIMREFQDIMNRYIKSIEP